jgi:hypothetical protein
MTPGRVVGMSDTTLGWDAVAPAARLYYDRNVEDAVEVAKEMCAEWSYEDDPHGYCHYRSVLVTLIQAVESHD